MTYQELISELQKLTYQQLACDVTVEVAMDDECYPAELRIAGIEHSSLDEDHPVIYVRD